MCDADQLSVVHLVQGARKYPGRRRWTAELLTICAACHADGYEPGTGYARVAGRERERVRWTHELGRGARMPVTPCEACGIGVVRHADPLLKRVTCSRACSTSLTRSRNGNKGSGRPCETCGELVTTGRADSRYCGSACRQKAYRQRKAHA